MVEPDVHYVLFFPVFGLFNNIKASCFLPDFLEASLHSCPSSGILLNTLIINLILSVFLLENPIILLLHLIQNKNPNELGQHNRPSTPYNRATLDAIAPHTSTRTAPEPAAAARAQLTRLPSPPGAAPLLTAQIQCQEEASFRRVPSSG